MKLYNEKPSVSWSGMRTRQLVKKSFNAIFSKNKLASLLIYQNYFKRTNKSWDQALGESTGYDDEAIIKKALESSRLVDKNEFIFGRDTVLQRSGVFDWPLMAQLLIACCDSETINVIDFGGGLGCSYQQLTAIKDVSKRIENWAIVEQEKFVNAGNKEFSTDVLSFYEKISDVKHKADVFIFSGSLGYIKSPESILCEVLKFKPKYIIFSRTSFSGSSENELHIQYVSKSIYKASFPVWALSRELIDGILQPEYEKVVNWVDDRQEPRDAILGGQTYKRILS